MRMADIRQKLRIFIIGLFGVVMALIFIRLFLVVIGANEESSFVEFWNEGLTKPFVDPFLFVYPNWEFGSIVFESASVLALFVYLIGALLVAKFITSFIDDDPKRILVRIVDTLFKIVEFLLLFRFLLRVTNASESGGFTDFIYNLSFLVYEPFIDVMPTLRFGDRDQFVFETSTLVAIVVVVILDLITESIIYNVFGKPEEVDNFPYKVNDPGPVYNTPPPQQPINNPSTTNINISVPPQQSQNNFYNPPSQNMQEPRQYLDVNHQNDPSRQIRNPNGGRRG